MTGRRWRADRIVVLRALGLGDLCTAVPALRALRAAYPEHELVLAAAAWQAPLAGLAGVDRLAPTCGLAPVPEREAAPYLAVNLHGRGPQSTQHLLDLEPRRLISFRHPVIPATETAPRWCAAEHEIQRWCRLLQGSGIPADPRQVALDVPAIASPVASGAVVVHPGAAASGRRWPVDRFAAVAECLLAAGERVVVTGSADERRLGAELVARAGGRTAPALVDLSGRTSIDELCALVAGARAVLSNDTGVAHLATAYRVPSVVLFGPTPPATWGPPPGPHVAIWKGVAGDPHGRQLHPGLAAITVEDVLAALADVIPAERVFGPCRLASVGKGYQSRASGALEGRRTGGAVQREPDRTEGDERRHDAADDRTIEPGRSEAMERADRANGEGNGRERSGERFEPDPTGEASEDPPRADG